MPDLSIIFVNWNTRDWLRQCLRALPAAVADRSAEVIVVDNASTDGSVEAVRSEFPSAHIIIHDTNRGFAAGNNAGLRIASGRYALLLNTDTLPEPCALQRMVDFADGLPRAGMVGALLLNPDGGFQASYAEFPSLLGETLLLLGLARPLLGPHFPSHSPRDSQRARRCDWVQGACLLVRRAALEEIGLMDESFFMYTEETDWCAECWKAGWEVWFTPEARVVHFGGQSFARQPAARRRQVYAGKARFFFKRRGALAGLTFRAIVQITAGLKLAMWAMLAAVRRGNQRVAARINVQAYLDLMGLRR